AIGALAEGHGGTTVLVVEESLDAVLVLQRVRAVAVVDVLGLSPVPVVLRVDADGALRATVASLALSVVRVGGAGHGDRSAGREHGSECVRRGLAGAGGDHADLLVR